MDILSDFIQVPEIFIFFFFGGRSCSFCFHGIAARIQPINIGIGVLPEFDISILLALEILFDLGERENRHGFAPCFRSLLLDRFQFILFHLASSLENIRDDSNDQRRHLELHEHAPEHHRRRDADHDFQAKRV